MLPELLFGNQTEQMEAPLGMKNHLYMCFFFPVASLIIRGYLGHLRLVFIALCESLVMNSSVFPFVNQHNYVFFCFGKSSINGVFSIAAGFEPGMSVYQRPMQ